MARTSAGCRRVGNDGHGAVGLADEQVVQERRAAVRRIGHRTRWQLDGPLQQGIIGRNHPFVQPLAQVFAHSCQVRVGGQIVDLVGVENRVVELLGIDPPMLPALGKPEISGRTFVAIGQDRRVPRIEALDVAPAIRAYRSLRLVGGVVGDLREDLVVDRVHLATERVASATDPGARGRLDPEQVADRGVEVDVRDERVGDAAAAERSGSAQDQQDSRAMVGEVALHCGEGEPVVGGAHDQRVGGETGFIQRVEDRPAAASSFRTSAW